ncbi:hypothetical protein GCM10010466_62340 [Planomonospora alba]|uniref:CopG family transcriptional regulator n=1 Tax=Planomonospora alba TaxID=161354 RepID=A0ABP6NZW8_9ACTN
MSTKPITITVDEDLHDYVQQEVAAGHVRSVSAFFNAAAARAIRLDREADAAWKAAVEHARQDPEAFERGRRRARRAQELLRAREPRHAE